MAKALSMDQLNELIECLTAVEDPRVQGRCEHLLIDIMVISVLGTLCGAEGIKDLFSFAVAKEKWLKKFLELPHGIPSEDTIARVLSLVDPNQVDHSFADWVKRINDIDLIKTISIDGKYSKGTDRASRINQGFKPLLVVSAFSHELGITLSEAEGPKGSEMQGALACIENLSLKGILVHVDAGLGSSQLVTKIVEKDGDYITPIKRNKSTYQDEIYEQIKNKMDQTEQAETANEGHSRGEIRHCYLLNAKDMSQRFKEYWPKVKVIFALVRSRTSEDKRALIQETDKDGKQNYRVNDGTVKFTEDVAYYVSSRKLTAKSALEESRRHWGIENKVHWVLDVAFREDTCLVRAKRLAKNLSAIRKMCLNLIRNSSTKGSVRGRIKQAGWNNDFLEKIVFG